MSRSTKDKPVRVGTELPGELTQARRFEKTRSAQSAAPFEDYVELIADLLATSGEARPTDIARRLGVSHATAIKTISRLKRKSEAPTAALDGRHTHGQSNRATIARLSMGRNRMALSAPI
jgi:DtxR family manganese transport transcriptional regulator